MSIRRILFCVGAVSLTLSLFMTVISSSVYAISTTKPAVKLQDSPLIITAFGLDDTYTPDDTLKYIEMYNKSDDAIGVDNWRIGFALSCHDVSTSENQYFIRLDSSINDNLYDTSGNNEYYIAPNSYAVFGFGGYVDSPNFSKDGNLLNCSLGQMSLQSAKYKPYNISINTSDQQTAKVLDKTRSGNYVSTGKYIKDTRNSLYQDDLYYPRDTFPLSPVEILPKSDRCSPLDTRISCGDYVKFYNNTKNAVNFDGVRMRIGYKGQSLSINNTIRLTGSINPGQYAIFNARDDGEPLKISDTGSYVWLEDNYGLKVYSKTVARYESPNTTHIGQSWALGLTGLWGWSSPNPKGQSILLSSQTDKTNSQDKKYVPCHSNQYRSPETHRCRLKKSKSSNDLKPCRSDQFRNPKTNRCKLKKSKDKSGLKPCKQGWTRNPDTHRCRKDKVAVKAASVDYPVTDMPTPKGTYYGWWVLMGVGGASLLVAIWEWRVEIRNGLRKLITIIHG